MNDKPYVIGIGGGTCSGKSTLAIMLAKTLGKDRGVSIIHLDDYYRWETRRVTAPFTHAEYVDHNHPCGVDVDAMNAGFSAAVSDVANAVVLVEGLFALHFAHIRERCDLKVYVDLHSDERLYRRIKRMISYESLDEIALRYLDTVRYRHDEFVEPTRWYADVVLNGALDMHVGVDAVAAYIDAQIRG